MGKEALNNIDGVEIYPLISLFIFVVFFIVLGIYVASMKKSHITQIKNIPLDNEPETNNNFENV